LSSDHYISSVFLFNKVETGLPLLVTGTDIYTVLFLNVPVIVLALTCVFVCVASVIGRQLLQFYENLYCRTVYASSLPNFL